MFSKFLITIYWQAIINTFQNLSTLFIRLSKSPPATVANVPEVNAILLSLINFLKLLGSCLLAYCFSFAAHLPSCLILESIDTFSSSSEGLSKSKSSFEYILFGTVTFFESTLLPNYITSYSFI